jgi:protein farnesyltransferase subunit beta
MASISQEPRPGIPVLFTQPPPIRDPLVTETLDLQTETVDKCLPFLQGIHTTQRGPFNALGVPALQRDDHVAYLYDSLEDYPAGFVAMDASRPWMVYWALAGLSLLGEDVTRFRER